MLFNSIDFAIFLPIVFSIYWFGTFSSIRLQNLFIIISSYIFYGWWDWRFLFLIFISTFVDYAIGLEISKRESKKIRILFLSISILVNIGFLGFFKYCNFFIDNFINAFQFFGLEFKPITLKIILPVGISFYTFQTLSYTIDVYKKKLLPTKDFFAFAAFVSFFPQLVAGPIERAKNLLPQFESQRIFDQHKAVDGLRQILWGLFKKIVIADNCAEFANMIFNNSSIYSGSTLILGAIYFAFQIYGDFSGYSDIAIGTARLFGFNLMRNFAFPYFSRDIAEFWRRWHISLSTWFRDYLYIPLGGSNCCTLKKIRNIFIIFIVSGFWHGANWTFIAWGMLNAIYFLPLMLTNKNRKNVDIVAKGKFMPSLKDFYCIIFTFSLTLIAWILFRAEKISHAYDIFSNIFSISIFKIPDFPHKTKGFFVVILIFLFMSIEWFGRENQFAIEKLGVRWPTALRWTMYYGFLLVTFYFAGKPQEFIYFQF